MKMRSGYVLLLCIILLGSTIGCQKGDPIKEEVVDTFLTIIDETMNTVNSDLARLDDDRIEMETKLLKLEEIVEPALAWGKDQEEKIDPVKKSSWITNVDRVWLEANLKNEYFQVSQLEFTVFNVGSSDQETTLKIRIKDLNSFSVKNWNEMDNELNKKVSGLEQKREALIEAGNLALLTFQNSIEYYEEWEVKKINKTTYSVSGPGLGIPSRGNWTYYQETSEIVPADKDSMTLKKVLSGES